MKEFKGLIDGFKVLDNIYEDKQPLKQDDGDKNVVKELEGLIGQFCQRTGEVIAFVDPLWDRLECDRIIKKQIKRALARYTRHKSKLVKKKLEEYGLHNYEHVSETGAQQQCSLPKTQFVLLKVATSALEGDLIIINHFVPLIFDLGTKTKEAGEKWRSLMEDTPLLLENDIRDGLNKMCGMSKQSMDKETKKRIMELRSKLKGVCKNVDEFFEKCIGEVAKSDGSCRRRGFAKHNLESLGPKAGSGTQPAGEVQSVTDHSNDPAKRSIPNPDSSTAGSAPDS